MKKEIFYLIGALVGALLVLLAVPLQLGQDLRKISHGRSPPCSAS